MTPFPTRGVIESFGPRPSGGQGKARPASWDVSRRTIAVFVAVLGAGLILAGWRLDNRQYFSSLFLELGSTVLLVLPLLWVESLFERRVVVPGQWERLRFRYVTEVSQSRGDLPYMRLSIEDAAGQEIGVRADWTSGRSPADVLVGLAETWKRAGSYPGDHAIDAEGIFGRLLLGLGVGIRGRQSRGDWQFNPLIEMVSTTWAMTDFGLEHVPDPYEIPGGELADKAELNDWRRHMGEKVWVERENEAARDSDDADFWMVTQVAHQFFRRQLATG